MSTAKIMRIFVRACVAIACICAGSAVRAAALNFPSHPLRLIVPYAPGGNADIMARLIAQRLGENVGHQVVVDNRPGASGIIGTELAVKAAPDGTAKLLPPVCTKPTITGPLLPALPIWMCAALPTTSLVCTKPLNVLSGLTRKVATPEAVVVFAGTSL